jgi:glycosyltransferase involved in cell wall biosynthesis
MSAPLTIYLIIKNNEATIEHTLESLLPLNANILVGDLGCKDETVSKCRQYGATIVRLSLNDDLSQARNHLLKSSDSKWNLHIEPWETILTGHEVIQQALLGPQIAYKMSIIQGDVITKQIRLWHKNTGLKFKNPVFETLTNEDAKDLPAYIAVGPNNNSSLYLELVEKWRDRCPLATEPIYYTACSHLNGKNWDTFLNWAGLYLHQEKSDAMSVYMTHYYCSMVNCYIKKDYQHAIQSLLPCLAKNPTMAEFWCLLGDAYYAIKDYDRAKTFYENAMILGSRRLKDDGWPLEISKYKEYPQKMIEGCEKIKQSLRFYGSKNQSHNSHH